MLVLTRKVGESIQVGDDVRLTVLSIQGQNVKVGILAPKEISIHREEIYQKIVEQSPISTLKKPLKKVQNFLRIGGVFHAEK